jgi:hypothetical protein
VAASALMPAIAQPPPPGMTARRTGEPARPAQPLQVVQAVRVSTEPCLELARRPGVVNSSAGLIHARILLRLSEYPRSALCANYSQLFTGYSLHSVSTHRADQRRVGPPTELEFCSPARGHGKRLRTAFYGQLLYHRQDPACPADRAHPRPSPSTLRDGISGEHWPPARHRQYGPVTDRAGRRATKAAMMHRLHRMPLAASLAPDGSPSLGHRSGAIILPGERDLLRIRRVIRQVRVIACEQ